MTGNKKYVTNIALTGYLESVYTAVKEVLDILGVNLYLILVIKNEVSDAIIVRRQLKEYFTLIKSGCKE